MATALFFGELSFEISAVLLVMIRLIPKESPWSWFGVVRGKDLPARSALPDLFIIKEY